MTLNTWLSNLQYAQKTSIQRSQVRAGKVVAEMGRVCVCVGGVRVLAHVAGRNTELGTGSASSQTPSFFHIQCFSSHGDVDSNCICVPVVPIPHPVTAWDGSK